MQLIAIIISLQVPSIMIVLVEATEYFVSFNGDDSNPGTLQKPWRHVQKAVTVLNPGDTCTIREGDYSEEVSISGLKGTMDKPITYRSYPGERRSSLTELLQYKVNGKFTGMTFL